jgi:hypothetical protein
MRLAIVGTEEQTRHLAPFGNLDYDIWVFNEAANTEWCKRWTACLQLHKPNVYRNVNKKDPQHWEWLQQDHKYKPIYMQDFDPLVPNCVKYPFDEVAKVTQYKRNFRATLTYAIALAIYQGYESIDIYGVELANSAEYRSQQNNFAFWVGLAEGHGIPINLHCCAGMFDKPLYAYEDYMEEEQIQKYVVGLEIQIEEAKEKLHKLEGAKMLAIQMLTDLKGDDVKEIPEPVQANN